MQGNGLYEQMRAMFLGKEQKQEKLPRVCGSVDDKGMDRMSIPLFSCRQFAWLEADSQNSMFGRRMIWVLLPCLPVASSPEYLSADSHTNPVARAKAIFFPSSGHFFSTKK